MTIVPATIPAVKTLITSDGTSVKRLDETILVDGVWESPTLNRGGSLVHRIVKLLLLYQADKDVAIEIEFTRDGGRIWSSPMTVRLTRSEGSTKQKLINAQMTGYDVRFRLTLPKRHIVSIFGYVTEQVSSGDLGVIGQ